MWSLNVILKVGKLKSLEHGTVGGTRGNVIIPYIVVWPWAIYFSLNFSFLVTEFNLAQFNKKYWAPTMCLSDTDTETNNIASLTAEIEFESTPYITQYTTEVLCSF